MKMNREEKLNVVKYAIDEERKSNEKKWGINEKHLEEWYLILSEEVGEIAKAILESDGDALWKELAQTGATILSMMTECVQLDTGPAPKDKSNIIV